MLEGREKGCLGCSMLLDAIDFCCPGYLKEYDIDDQSVQLGLQGSGLTLYMPRKAGVWPTFFRELGIVLSYS